MAIFTLAEIDAQIAVYKAAYTAAASGKKITSESTEIERLSPTEIMKHLQWLDGQRDQLTATGGIQTRAVGRTYAVNGRGN
jgi:hypothetical protein